MRKKTYKIQDETLGILTQPNQTYKMKDNNIKPDWITDKQWENVPSVQWWEDSKLKKEYLEQSKPVTVEEALAQMERLRNSKNWKEGA
jgi:hypothetical protein